MEKHDFGIMENGSLNNEQFDVYEPEKYHCIELHDDFIEDILMDLENVPCYWHTLQVPGKGLAYCGITLIPPQSMELFIQILSSRYQSEYNDLISLSNQAKQENKYIIHFEI